MLLTVDIGNTSITLGLFDDDALIENFRLASDSELPQEEYEILLKSLLSKYNVKAVIIGSVVNELDKKFKAAADAVFKLNSIIVDYKMNTIVKIATDTPEEVGADRIANACGAFMLYKRPVIVIDFGTATTFDIVNYKGEFLGGVITPGLNLQLKTLNKFTSKLPQIDIAKAPAAIGRNTVDAILSGVIRGSACLIDGLIRQCEAELGEKATIVATGGYCTLIEKYMISPFDFINPTLTLEGLRFLYEAALVKNKK